MLRRAGSSVVLRCVFSRVVGWGLLALGQAAAFTNERGPEEPPVIRSWGTETGLPQNTVNAIVQTRDGYLWLGTRDGLARFDGVRFTVFGLREGLQGVEVQTLYEDRQGTLWIGTSGGGLSRIVDGRIESVNLPQGLGSGSDVVTSLAEDLEGRLWVGTSGGLSLWHEGRFIQNEALGGLGRAGIRTLLRDQCGAMWIATLRQGLFAFKANELRESLGPAGDERISAYCLLEDQKGGLWASVGNGKVLCRRGEEWDKYDQTNGLPFAYVTSLAEEADGTIWAGSLDDGLYRFDAGRFTAIRKEHGLSANDIRSLRPDREGNLWVGTRTGGLDQLSRRKLVSYGAEQGLTNDYTRSVGESADGTLWVATTGGGLYRGGPGGFKAVAPYYSFAESVLATQDGSLWCGAARALLCWKDGRLTGSYTDETWVHSATVTALCEDQQGGLWIGTSQSKLVHFQNGEFAEFPKRVARGPVTALAQQANGSLWVGSMAGGLKRVRSGSDLVLSLTNGLLSQAIRTLHLDSEGTLWIGTAGGGLGRWRDGRMANFTTREGLGANTVVQIVEDDDGYLWLGCSRGIFRVRKSDLNDLAAGKIAFVHPRAFGVADGMPTEECSSGFCPAGLKTKTGLLCFSTVKGLVLLDPRTRETNARPPNVLLEEVLLNGQVRMVDAGALSGPQSPTASESPNLLPFRRLSIPPGGREVELHYTAINFASPTKLRFRYRLEGMDRDWIEAGERRTAYYHHLPARDLVFRVTACNADGVWSDQGAALALTVQPFLWETPWFLVATGVAILGLLAGTMRLAERTRYQRRLAQLETQHAVERERLRISQDMHDDIGGILTQVSQLSDLGQSETAGPVAAKGHFERIGGHARAAVQALDEIVWATNPKNDNLPRFAEYVCRFADEYFETTTMRCWQEVPTHLPNLLVRADVRHNVFLAVKEAFNNILKHSAATEVWLRLALDHSGVCLAIEDNGRGFTPEQTPPDGNGLDNMKARLAECGGRMELASGPSQGTKIRFLFPVPKAG